MSNSSGQNASPITFLTDSDTQELREYNQSSFNERSKVGIPDYKLNSDLIVQRYSKTLVTTDTQKFNPDLSSGMKENIIRRQISSPFSAKGPIDQIVESMMNDDTANNWANLDAILSKTYTTVSVGVAWNNMTTCT